MTKRIRAHLRSNVVAYTALFFALSGSAVALQGHNSVFSDDIKNGEVKRGDIAVNSINAGRLAADSVRTEKVLDETLGSSDLGPDSVGGSEIIDDSVASAEIAPGVVGADELDSVHEHFGTATNITDTTAHDGAYSTGTQSVSCGTGEDLLSVSVDWTATGGHNELVFSGVNSITRGEPDTAIVKVAYDGGATTATLQPAATCIF
jgi:hypothetical protein